MRQNLPESVEQSIHYAGPILLIFGTVFGIFTCVVLNQVKMRRSKIRFYLIAQSINDILVLCISLLDFYLRHALLTDLSASSPLLCKLWPFLDRSVRQLASWIVVGISTERLAGCLFPIPYFTSQHKHRPVCFIVAIVLIAAANAPSFRYNKLISYKMEVGVNSTRNENHIDNDVYHLNNVTLFPKKLCFLTDGYYSTSLIVFYIIYWLIPLFSLIGSNIYLGKWLCDRNRWQKNTPDMRITVAKSKCGMKRNFRESLIAIFTLSALFFLCITPLAICELSQLSRAVVSLTPAYSDSIPEVHPVHGVFPPSCMGFQLFSYVFYATKFIFYMGILTSFREDCANIFKNISAFLPCIGAKGLPFTPVAT